MLVFALRRVRQLLGLQRGRAQRYWILVEEVHPFTTFLKFGESAQEKRISHRNKSVGRTIWCMCPLKIF